MPVRSVALRVVLAWLPPLLWAGLVFFLSSIPGTQLPQVVSFPMSDKVEHGFVYAVFGALCFRALRSASTLPAGRAVAVAALIAAAYGVSDELHQTVVPNRMADVRDALADAIGGTAGAIMAWRLGAALRARREARRAAGSGTPPARRAAAE